MAERKAKWQNDYIAKAYDRINLTVPKGQKERIRAGAAVTGESTNAFINRLINAELDRLRAVGHDLDNGTGDGSGFSDM
jgi:hypothetical protein